MWRSISKAGIILRQHGNKSKDNLIRATADTVAWRLFATLQKKPLELSKKQQQQRILLQSSRSIYLDHYQNDNNVAVVEDNNKIDVIPLTTPSPPPKSRRSSRGARSRSKSTKKRLIDDKNVPSYKEFVHRFTVLSLYRGYLKTIRESMPHNQRDLLHEVRKEFQSCKSDTDSIIIKNAILNGKRRFEELKEFTGQNNKYEGTSWMNIQDTDDPRGRVGTNWPWEK